MSKEIAIKENYSPVKMKDMTAMANVLKEHIVKNGLFTEIIGKKYVHVDGWAYAGGLMGLFPKVTSVTNLSTTGEYKWRADVEIVNMDGKVMGIGVAICSSKESKKKTFDEYAVLSMAQTRAIGRAYRNLIGWVMKLGGMEATPSEEMVKHGETVKATVMPAENVSQETVKKPGQVKGPDGEWTFVCEKDGDPISEAVNTFSMKKVGKHLCREHLLELSAKKGNK